MAPILTEIWPLVSPVIISEIVAKNLENTVENLTEKTNSTKKKNEENSGNSKSIIKKINEICRVTKDINDSLNEIERVYTEYFADIKNFCKEDKSYFDYTEVEREKIKNTILLVKLLSELCRTTPVKKRYEYDYEDINCSDANKVVTNVRAEFEKIKRR